MEAESNMAFVDGQNLHMGTAKREVDPWRVNLARFRFYLQKKYSVAEAYYFLGYVQDENQDLYTQIQKAGFILMFKKHTSAMMGTKKGNVDSDIIFLVMKKLYKKDFFEKIVLVSGDGDYLPLVDFLIEEGRFKKILFPNKKYRSSLYKTIGSEYFDYLENSKEKIEIKKEKGSLGS